MSRETFERGVLYGLAIHGWTPERIGNVLQKSAFAGSEALGAIGSALNTVGTKMLPWAGDAAGAAAVGIPLIGGAAAGSLAYAATRPDYDDLLEQAQRRQLLRELTLKTRTARMKARQSESGIVTAPAVT